MEGKYYLAALHPFRVKVGLANRSVEKRGDPREAFQLRITNYADEQRGNDDRCPYPAWRSRRKMNWLRVSSG